MRSFESFLQWLAIVLTGLFCVAYATKDEAAKPSPDCPCVDCTCDPCECGPVDPDPEVPKVDPDPVKPSGEAIAYFFTRADCPPCHQSRPHINAAHQEGYTVYVVDLSRKDLIDRYGIEQWPTTVVTRGGDEVERHVGLINGRILQGIFSRLGIQPKQRTTPAATNQQRIIRQDAYRQPAMRQTGGVRGGRVFSACGPGGCG